MKNMIPLNLLDNDGKLSFLTAFAGLGSQNTLPLRDVPKGAKIISESDGAITISLKTAILYWWTAPLVVVPPLLFYVLWPLSSAIVVAMAMTLQMRGGLFLLIVGLIPALYIAYLIYKWIYKKTHPETKITITAETVTIGKIVVPRDHLHGFIIGTQQGQEEDTQAQGVFSSFKNNQIFWVGLMVRYGQWGETLPYMVSKDQAAYYVIWLNQLLKTVGAPEPSLNAASEGRREQSF